MQSIDPPLPEGFHKARLRAKLPAGGLPDSFVIITVWNPLDVTISPEENAARSEEFRKELEAAQFAHFPVTGYDPMSSHLEEGFGVICDLETALAFGRKWEQLAIFRVKDGEVYLVSCSPSAKEFPPRSWESMADS